MSPKSVAGSCQTRAAAGDPADAIVQVAQDLGVDLIVMAMHGRAGLQHVLLRSTAERVIRHAPGPA